MKSTVPGNLVMVAYGRSFNNAFAIPRSLIMAPRSCPNNYVVRSEISMDNGQLVDFFHGGNLSHGIHHGVWTALHSVE